MTTYEDHVKNESATNVRTWSRLKCDVPTEISVDWGDRWGCRIVDMSQRGLGIVTTARLKKGDVVNIRDPKTKARVIWARDNRVGLRVSN